MIDRLLYHIIRHSFYEGKIILITGPRQAGKSTLLEFLEANSKEPVLFLNCDEPDTRTKLEKVTSVQLKSLIGKHKLVLIDEAQRVRNIGLTLKLMADHFKSNIQVIATGSSALELANEINEPLTGRKFSYHLYPFSTQELVNSSSTTEETRLLEQRMVYGLYPDVVNNPEKADRLLIELSSSYLYKDILALQDVRKPVVLEKLLTAIALQLGSEVSINELSQTVGVDNATIERYIDLLEKCYVIYQMRAFSRNLRNEIRKSRKIYFLDNGIRNAVINNFSPLALRQDTGALWENFLMTERMKYLQYAERHVKPYFWRTHQQQEIDRIEEAGGRLTAIEFKWNERKRAKIPTAFTTTYPGSDTMIINRKNYLEFIS